MIDEAIRGERSKFNCEFLCLGCLIPVKVYLEQTKVHFIQILTTNALLLTHLINPFSVY